MRYGRKYVQFNELVIDAYSMIDDSDQSTDVSFKYNSSNYTGDHGSYTAFKKEYSFVEEGSVAMTIFLRMKKLPCDKRPYFYNFALWQITRPGMLWAVQNNTLIWAKAIVTSYSMVESPLNDTLEINLDFKLPEGIWHKADKQKTFLKPYDLCSYLDCYHFKTLNPCEEYKCDCEHCGTLEPKHIDCRCECCYCDTILKDWALCYQDLQEAFIPCNPTWHISYNCEKAKEFFGELGQRYCSEPCSNTIAGMFYSDTDIPTTNFGLVMYGVFHNAEITINGNTNVIQGDYNGALTITGAGDIYFRADPTCCSDELIDVSNWYIPSNMNYGWTIYPQENQIVINAGSCCVVDCVYIQVDAITI